MANGEYFQIGEAFFSPITGENLFIEDVSPGSVVVGIFGESGRRSYTVKPGFLGRFLEEYEYSAVEPAI